jgi:hypothetical protein
MIYMSLILKLFIGEECKILKDRNPILELIIVQVLFKIIFTFLEDGMEPKDLMIYLS